MTAYYNENNKFAANRLRYLISNNLIAPGDVDERNIVEVKADDLRGYNQCHFFAGIGGWSLAFRYAGIPDNEPVWSGSCPCQPFSLAGKQNGFADERHLWPAWRNIIRERIPSVIFGEQVASNLGRNWLTGVRIDLENMAYAVGAADLCAASIGAPHIRNRLYWVADANQARWSNAAPCQADAERHRVRTNGVGRRPSHWDRDGEQVRFKDGSQRRTKSGVDIMVNGFPGRVDMVAALGNAIVPQLAAVFIRAALTK